MAWRDNPELLQCAERVASAAHTLAEYGSTITSGGEDWRGIESANNMDKEKGHKIVDARIGEVKPKLHITLYVEGDCTGSTPLWTKYLGEVARTIKAYPPKSGKAFVTINVLAKAKGVKTEVGKDGSTFTVTGARDLEASGWPKDIEMPFKRVSSKN